jgi:methylmalonyl-CoA epimerase
MPRKIQHISFLVESIEESIKYYNLLFNLKPRIEKIENEKVLAAFYEFENIEIELIQPLKGNLSLNKRLQSNGNSFHHMAIEVENIDHELERLKNLELTSSETSIRKGANNSKVSFIKLDKVNRTLIELVEKNNKN